MARAKKSAPDAPAGDAPSQSPESTASATPTKTVAKKGAATGGKRRQDRQAPAGPRLPARKPPSLTEPRRSLPWWWASAPPPAATRP